MTRRRAKKKKTQFTQTKREGTATPAEKKTRFHPSRKALILAFSGILILSACAFWINWHSESQQAQDSTTDAQDGANTNVPRVSRAAILDGLYDKYPNLTWTESAVNCLSELGYDVDVYRGTNVTINLLRNIGGYEILILRLHSAIHADNFLYLFSGEQYTESKYVDEQLAGAVRKAYTFNESEPPYFALNAVFMGKNKPNGLNGTTLIMMGCYGMADDYVIQRFFQEGVKTYISWDGYVNLPDSDETTLKLLKAMFSEGLRPDEAVEKVNKEVGPDPSYGSKLKCASP